MPAINAPTIYKHTDTGAPAHTHGLGLSLPWFKAILTTGYPLSTAIQLTYGAGKVTVNKTAHGMEVGDITTVWGADQDEYNGRVEVTDVTDADNFSYVPLSVPSVSPATGTITFSDHGGKPGLGWQLVFVDAGIETHVYRPRYGNRRYLRLRHDQQAYSVNARGFETMTDASNGTGDFPTTTQLNAGVLWQWSNNTASNRPWVVIGDDTVFYGIIHVSTTSHYYAMGFMFGDFPSFKAGDLFNTIIIGRHAASASPAGSNLEFIRGLSLAAEAGHYVPRAVSQTGISLQVGKSIDYNRHTSDGTGEGRQSGRGSAGTTTTSYPAPVDGGLHLSRFFIVEPGQGVRGYLRGLWCVCHDIAQMTAVGASWGDTFTGSDGLAGRTFELRGIGNQNNGHAGAVCIETSDTWNS